MCIQSTTSFLFSCPLGSCVSFWNFETIRGSLIKPKWQKLASLAQEICTLLFQFFGAVFASKGYPFKNIFNDIFQTTGWTSTSINGMGCHITSQELFSGIPFTKLFRVFKSMQNSGCKGSQNEKKNLVKNTGLIWK